VLDDEKHRVHVQTPLASQGFGGRPAKLDAVPFAGLDPQVILGSLVVVHPHELKWRLVVESIARVSVNEPARDVIRVRTQAVDRIDCRHPRMFFAIRISSSNCLCGVHLAKARSDRE
jgi:hypothetical protein